LSACLSSHHLRLTSSTHLRPTLRPPLYFLFFATPPPQFLPLPLHDALPICQRRERGHAGPPEQVHPLHQLLVQREEEEGRVPPRSEEHTSELQSLTNLVCRLLLEKKKYEEDNDIIVVSQTTLDSGSTVHSHT